MGKWNAGNVVAGLAIVGGVGAGVALLARDANKHDKETAGPHRAQAYIVLGRPVACPDVTSLHAARNATGDGRGPDPLAMSQAGCRYLKAGDVLIGVDDGGLVRFSQDGRRYWIHPEDVSAQP